MSDTSPHLTAGEECQATAKSLSSFLSSPVNRGEGIPGSFVSAAMGLAVLKGNTGVALVRLKTKEWSAPCAICLQSTTPVQSGQETVLLFMSQKSIYSLVGRTPLVFGSTHSFSAGPLSGSALHLDPSVDVYAYVRFNGGFTPSQLINTHMCNWTVSEDPDRHGRWHGKNVTWFDVLTNKITVDRSSVGNALYVVLNLASAGQGSESSHNVADLDPLIGIAPSVSSSQQHQSISIAAPGVNQQFQQVPMYSQPRMAQQDALAQQQLLLLQQQSLLLQQQQMQYPQNMPAPMLSSYQQWTPEQQHQFHLLQAQQQQQLLQQQQSGQPYNPNFASGSGLLGDPSSYNQFK